MNYIVAFNYQQGKHFARYEKHWSPTEFQVVTDTNRLRGLQGVTVWFVDAPRYRPTSRELENRVIAREIVQAQSHRIKIEEAVLP
jgi:hypothetical protein